MIREPHQTSAPVIIEDDVFIGTGAIIVRGCRICAGSVVRGDIPAYSIAIGNPAKIVGSRK